MHFYLHNIGFLLPDSCLYIDTFLLFATDGASFYDILVKFIYQALRQREKECPEDERDWVLMEAMNSKKLLSGGTFRNVLGRRFNEVITPYFTELIAHADQNNNLDLLGATNQKTPISVFWLEMFSLICGQIDFSSVILGKGTDVKTLFSCKLPFSWFVKEEVEAQRTHPLG